MSLKTESPSHEKHSLPSGYCMRLEISCLLVNFASCLQRMGAFCCHAWCALMCYHPTTTVLLTSHGQSGIFITCCSMVPVTNSGQRRLFWSGPNIEPSPTSMLLFELAALPLPKVSWSNEHQKRKKGPQSSPPLASICSSDQALPFMATNNQLRYLSVGHVMVKIKIQVMQGVNSSIRRHSLRQTPLGFVYNQGCKETNITSIASSPARPVPSASDPKLLEP